MKKKTTGFIAGAAGVALLVSGSTFALWSDDADIAGGTLTSGNLDLETTGFSWKEVSDDVNSPKTIDLADSNETFRAVPGDQIKGTVTAAIDLVGDNMKAELGVADLTNLVTGTAAGGHGPLTDCLSEPHVTVTKDGSPIFDSTTDSAPGLPLSLTVADSGNYTLVLETTFNSATADQGQQCADAATAKLRDLTLELTQVRP